MRACGDRAGDGQLWCTIVFVLVVCESLGESSGFSGRGVRREINGGNTPNVLATAPRGECSGRFASRGRCHGDDDR